MRRACCRSDNNCQNEIRLLTFLRARGRCVGSVVARCWLIAYKIYRERASRRKVGEGMTADGGERHLRHLRNLRSRNDSSAESVHPPAETQRRRGIQERVLLLSASITACATRLTGGGDGGHGLRDEAQRRGRWGIEPARRGSKAGSMWVTACATRLKGRVDGGHGLRDELQRQGRWGAGRGEKGP